MNARRAANRSRSMRGDQKDWDMVSPTAERHEQMRGRKLPEREPEHHEIGGNHRHQPHASHASPASVGASKGAGPLPGAGELPAVGPGEAAKGYAGGVNMPVNTTPTGAAPKGMRIWNQE